MSSRFRIGNQTAYSANSPLDPFHFAVEHGFDAFEWFVDKKVNAEGFSHGWEESDFDEGMKTMIRRAGEECDMLFTVHAPWQANPLFDEGLQRLHRSIDFAKEIGARIVNLHLYMDRGAQGFVDAMAPIVNHAQWAGVRISIENTVLTSPADFNETFACFSKEPYAATVGMCLDIGHANLCDSTRHNFVRYIDLLLPTVPIIHLHVHENYGDHDSHMTLFTGPSQHNDSGVRAFISRMNERGYHGAVIMEQWPHPAELLVQAASRLNDLIAQTV